MLEGSQVVESTGDTITLAVASSLAKRLAEERNTSVIANAVTNVIGGVWKVAIQPAGTSKANGDSGPSAAAPPADSDPRDDPDYEPGPPAAAAPVDAETEAMRLLQDRLDARPLDG
jgi:DNA polymerase III subunit gamma/tau